MESERTREGSAGTPRGTTAQDETVRAQRIREQELSREVRPFLVQQYRDRVDPAAAAEAVAARFPIDQHKAYRWTSITYEELERSRRQIARIFATVMWLGAVLIVVPVVGALTGRISETTPSAVVPVAIGLVLLVSGITGGLNARRFIPSRSP